MTHEVKAVANPDPELGTSFLAAVTPIEGAHKEDLLRMAASAHSFAPYGDEKGVLCFYTHDDTMLCYPHINPDTGKPLTENDFGYACLDMGIDPNLYIKFWKPYMGLPSDPDWPKWAAQLDRHCGRA